MNAMGHNQASMIGVDHQGVAEKISRLIPSYMTMGDKGMADMGAMQMPLPDNTLPMMSGDGPFGNLEMGGMFSVLKVRKDQKTGDYRDPGWYRHPPGSMAYEYQGTMSEPVRAPQHDHAHMHHGVKADGMAGAMGGEIEVQVVKPQGHAGH